ncbi:MAG: hypothetical protein ABSG41_05475 [Bryobacteraceae bacterium]|jgi:hypothetical protein
MSVRKLLEKEILIRLTGSGFVETIQCFGLERSLAYEMDEPETTEEAVSDQRLIFARVHAKRSENRGTRHAP